MWDSVLRMKLPGRSSRERPERWFMKMGMGDLGEVGLTKEGVEDRSRWKLMMRCNDP